MQVVPSHTWLSAAMDTVCGDVAARGALPHPASRVSAATPAVAQARRRTSISDPPGRAPAGGAEPEAAAEVRRSVAGPARDREPPQRCYHPDGAVHEALDQPFAGRLRWHVSLRPRRLRRRSFWPAVVAAIPVRPTPLPEAPCPLPLSTGPPPVPGFPGRPVPPPRTPACR